MTQSPTPPVYTTKFPTLKFYKRGKVRDLYALGERLLIVATDRLSAYDVIMPQPIPDKGKVLTRISNFWFARTADIVSNHLIEIDVSKFPPECAPYHAELEGRSVLVRRSQPLPIECVVRGYLAGSAWQEYKRSGSVCGVALPTGLVESSRLEEPIFTPATKAETGHDENITFEDACSIVGPDLAATVRDYSLEIFRKASAFADEKGIIIADTKMEFGIVDGAVMLIDELLTPDSSRFWPKRLYVPGTSQPGFDKQFVRDYLTSINFNRQPPGPMLPDEVILRTSQLYKSALLQLTGEAI